MANPAHLAKLKEGVEAWSRWRRENPQVEPDLFQANLAGADLRKRALSSANLAAASLNEANLLEANLDGANLRGADLRKANLTRATLWEADLYQANLAGGYLLWANLLAADLRKANLSRANLLLADLSGSFLQEADLRAANLDQAKLQGADLSGADLREAELFETVFGRTNLTDAIGLGECRHHGPSTIDHRTLEVSGPLPAAFLRGCGLPDALIADASSLLGKPSQYHSCFISYKHADLSFANRLHELLQDRGIRCWLDRRHLAIGEEILPAVLHAIRQYDRVILCCSEASVTSEWVETELEETFAKEEKEGRPILLPLDLDGYLFKGWKGPLAVKVRKRLAADFTGWEQDNAKFEAAFERVVEALRAGGE